MRRLSILAILIVVTLSCWASPARRIPMKVQQPDGTEITVLLQGDEFFHYYTTLDGVVLFKEADGSFSYAGFSEDGTIISSNLPAHNSVQRSLSEKEYIAAHRLYQVNEPAAATAKRNNRNAMRTRTRTKELNTIGTVKIPVILVEYTDVKFSTSKTDMENHFNGVNYTGDYEGSYGSVRDYFIAQSGGKFTPEFDILGIETLPNKMEYYGENNAKDDDKRPEEMVIDACKQLDSIVDFSVYDNDGDGTIEFIYLVYAGYSEASNGPKNSVWAHQWSLSEIGKSFRLDNVKLDTYACSSELYLNKGTQIDGIGSVCHEFSHCLGLPDFYDTSGNKYFGMDIWSLMDYGCYNLDGFCPCGYSAYEKEFVGWMEIETIDEPINLTLEPLNKDGKAYRIVNDAGSNEYYIIENRQKTAWDKYIPNHGMLIFHVDYSASAWNDNSVNSNKNHQRMTLIPADGELLSYYDATTTKAYTNSLKGDVWPGTSGKTALTDETEPAAVVYKGSHMSKPLTNIEEKDGVITLRFKGGTIETPALSEENTQEISVTSFKVAWESIEGADGYTVVLYLQSSDSLQWISSIKTDSCKYTFENLLENCTYCYSVRGENEFNASAYSDTVSVTLLPVAIKERRPAATFILYGHNLQIQGEAGDRIEVYSLDGRLQEQVTLEREMQELRLERGRYIVRMGEQSSKIEVK